MAESFQISSSRHEMSASRPQVKGTGNGLQMTPERMRELGQKVVELLVERMESLPDDGAWEGDFQQSLREQLLENPPETGRPAEEVIARAARDILPFATRLDHPRCFGFVPSAPTWPGVLADFMASAYNINACTWLVASGPSQIELVIMDWFRQWFGYTDKAGGLLTSGGSAAAVNAFVTAREAAGNPERTTVYMSNQSHSAQIRAARIVGVRQEFIRLLPTDANHRLDIDALRRAVADDRAAGLTPILICANAGATSNGAVDPLNALAQYCADETIWLHVDASYGGFAVLTERGKQLLQGIEHADSIAVDAHKWLFQPYEVGALLVRDAQALEDAFRIHHDVLQDTIWGANHPNFSDRSLQLSRSFRALKVWMSIQTFGLAAFRQAIDNGITLAERAADYIGNSSVLELMAPVSLGVVCFRINPRQSGMNEDTIKDINRTILAHLFWDDRAFISSTLVAGAFSLRLCIINHTTIWKDVQETLEAAESFARTELGDRSPNQQ